MYQSQHRQPVPKTGPMPVYSAHKTRCESSNHHQKLSLHTRTVASFNIPFGWLGKASFASSPKSPNGALNFVGILENIFRKLRRVEIVERSV